VIDEGSANRVIIVGGGPAGCSCALWLALQGIRSTLIEQEPQLLPLLSRLDHEQSWVLGFPGTRTAELAQRYAKHVRSIPSIEVHCSARVDEAELLAPERKVLRLSDGTVVEGSAIVFATGLQSRRLEAAVQGSPQPLDAVELTARRPALKGRRILLLGGGDNAVENALLLAAQANQVVLWSRGPLRAQRHLQAQLWRHSNIEQRIGIPMPSQVQHASAGWRVTSPTWGDERFDELAVLFGFESNDSAWRWLQQTRAWHEAGWPQASLFEAGLLRANGLFLAGDVSQRLHPCIQTALADGVTAAKQVARWLSAEASLAAGAGGVPAASAPQTLTLTGLRFEANLGILDHERSAPQPIRVDAELNLGPQPMMPRDDDIYHVLDYRKVRRIIIEECTAEHVNLLETLIGKLAHRLMQLPGVVGARVRITKLEIFDDCEVAIRVEAGQW